MIDVASLRLMRGKILVEPAYDPDRQGSFFRPVSEHERYSQVGWVLAKGELKEDIKVGDVVIFPNEGIRVGLSYYRVLRLTLKDFGDLDVDEGMEPVIKEAVEQYRRTKRDLTITLEDEKGEHYRMLTSDVLSWTFVDLPNPQYGLDYVDMKIIRIVDGGKVNDLYLLHEDNVLMVLEDW